MKRWIVIYLFLCATLVFVLVVLRPQTNQGAAFAQQNNTQYPTSTPYPTNTFIPTVTIGYEETLIVAQSTADEARRINAVVTSEYEQRVLEQLQMTAEEDRRIQERLSWTATAALTSIPLTQTQQSVINTQIPMQNNLALAQLTATAQAPTQIAALIQAQESVQFVRLNKTVDVIAKIVLIVFILSIVWFFFSFPVQPKQEIPEPPSETVVMLKQDHGQGSFSLKRTVIPCTREQLTELALKVTTGKKTLAINNWEGADTLFTRPTILRVRSWLHLNKFAVSTDDNQLVPTPEGFDFFAAWLGNQVLPDEYEFDDINTPSPSHDFSMRNHEYEHKHGKEEAVS